MNNDTLKRVRIVGFKSIRTCDVHLGRTNVLIGSNGAGKSNFVSVFAFLHDVLAKELQVSVAKSGVNALLYGGRKATDKISLEFDFGQNGYGISLVPTDDGSLVIHNEYLKCNGLWENKDIVTRISRESRLERRFGDKNDRLAQSVLAHQNWRVYHFHDTGRDSRIKQEHLLANNTALASDASNLAAFLLMLREAYPRNYQRVVATVRLAAPFFSDFVLIPNAANGDYITLRWRQAGSEDVLGASQFSDGTLRFACLAALLLQPPELQPPTIIVDEPELGLHPYAIGLLADMIRGLPESKQAIVSTQSVELLNEFDAEDVVVVDRDASGSKFSRLDEDSLSSWIEDYSLGELWKMNLIGGRLSR
ncbi:MAG: AAA family ATPase [Atopobiaceae bacterium]|nr:AAA family ATPase [Atopobiaceae bacterium]